MAEDEISEADFNIAQLDAESADPELANKALEQLQTDLKIDEWPSEEITFEPIDERHQRIISAQSKIIHRINEFLGDQKDRYYQESAELFEGIEPIRILTHWGRRSLRRLPSKDRIVGPPLIGTWRRIGNPSWDNELLKALAAYATKSPDQFGGKEEIRKGIKSIVDEIKASQGEGLMPLVPKDAGIFYGVYDKLPKSSSPRYPVPT